MWQKFKNSFAGFMSGRYGGDQLSRTCVITGLVLYVLSWITRVTLFSYIGLALYIWSIYRMFSRNREKRAMENQKYLRFMGNIKTNVSQAKNRAKNSKEYKYFHCPKCRSYLKLPRGVGEVTVTCGKCKNQFRKKA
jgi:flagellar biosynthesis component FlhA